MSHRDFLPYGAQAIDAADEQAVIDCLRSGWLTQGPAVDAFERELARRTEADHAVACSSGTAALHLAALAAGFGPGDWAVVPAITFMATANAMRYCDAEVVFADVDPESGLMGPEHLERALAEGAAAMGRPARAVLPVNLNGQCVELEAIAAIAHRDDLAVIVDGCHSIGGRYVLDDGRDVAVGGGSLADFTCFSFHPVKTIAMGEGGAVTTSNADAAERMRRLRSHGIERRRACFVDPLGDAAEGDVSNPWYHEMSDLGFNYRASDLHCALGLSQLGKLDDFVRERRRLAAVYDTQLAPLAPLVRPVGGAPRQAPAWHLYAVLADFAATGRPRNEVMAELHQRGIGTQVHYIPVCRQPYYRERYGDVPVPGADAYYAGQLSLPLFVGMNDDDVAYVSTSLREVLGG